MQQAHFAELPPERHRELLARMAFLVTRGALPDVAYHRANDGMVLDEMEDEAEHGIDWDVVKAVADAWPDPARGADARPVPGVLALARNLVGLVEATIEVPQTLEDNRDQLAELCLSARMRKLVLELFESERTRRSPPVPEEPEGEAGAGEAGEGDGPYAEWYGEDGLAPF